MVGDCGGLQHRLSQLSSKIEYGQNLLHYDYSKFCSKRSKMEFVLYYIRRIWRRLTYKYRRFKWKGKRMWDRFKWCLIGGFAYAAGRTLWHYVRDLI